MVTVNDLNVPPPAHGEDMAAALTRSLSRDSQRVYTAYVTDGTPDSQGRVGVRVDQKHTLARLRSTAKAVRTGDTVQVTKTGGAWRVVGAETWHEPPAVSGSMGNKPPAASTVSGSNIPTLTFPPSGPSSSTNAALQAWAFTVSTWLSTARLRINQNTDANNAQRSAINTNASRLNQTRDYASNAGQLVEPVVGALRDEGIVR